MSSKDKMIGIFSVSTLEYLNPGRLITFAPHPASASIAAFASIKKLIE
jgi:hypothetical protein